MSHDFYFFYLSSVSILIFAYQVQDGEEPQEPEPLEKWEQASATEQDQDEEEEGVEGEGGEMEGGGAPDGPVDFTIKSEQQQGAAGTAEEANDMAAFLASAVRSAAQFQVRNSCH